MSRDVEAGNHTDLRSDYSSASQCQNFKNRNLDILLSATPRNRSRIVSSLAASQRAELLRHMAPDDVADLLQISEAGIREQILDSLDEERREDVTALLPYDAETAGGLMTPRYASLNFSATVEEAIESLREQALRNTETVYDVYVFDDSSSLVGVTGLRELLIAPSASPIREIMNRDFVTTSLGEDQELVARKIAEYDLNSIPVLDEGGTMRGIVTVDDVVDVIKWEDTEDIHKIGGAEALPFSYSESPFLSVVSSRATWLVLLFIGALLTTSTVAHYQDSLSSMIVLTAFIPLIISSGGNAGTQATTLIIRSMALGELQLEDWLRVIVREATVGLCLGLILSLLGLARILGWEVAFGAYGDTVIPLTISISVSIFIVVLWGTICGASLPFILQALKKDPAGASAPMVTTILDITGLFLYLHISTTVLGLAK